MKKRKSSNLKKMTAVLLSAVLTTGMLSSTFSLNMQAKESTGSPENMVLPENTEAQKTVSGNNAEPVFLGAVPQGPMTTVDEPAVTLPVSGTDWELGADGKLTIRSDAGMDAWRDRYGESTFQYRRYVISVEISEGVTRIEENAFTHCINMASITLPESLTSIGDNAFTNCSSLTSINLPENVTSISQGAFSYCTRLTSITIPKSVTNINYGTFYECSGLTSITIPESVTSIGFDAFYNCSSLTDIIIPDKVTSIEHGLLQGCSSLKSVTIPEGVTSIGSNAFLGCGSLTNIAIPEGVTSIGQSAFCYCSSLTDITIPEGVTSIEDRVFQECISLKSITIPEGVTSIGANAFQDCSHLTRVTMLNETPAVLESSRDGNIETFSGCKFVTDNTKGIHVPEGRVEDYQNAWVEWKAYIADTNEPDTEPHVHNYGTEWKSDEDGHWHECSCGDKADAAAHSEDAGVVTTQPTETETGIRTYHCSVCGYEMRTETIPAMGSGQQGGDTGSADKDTGDVGGNTGSADKDTGDVGGNAGSADKDMEDVIETAGEAVEEAVVEVQTYDNAPVTQKEKEPKTGDLTPVELYATLAMIAGFAYLLLYFADYRRGMTEETKKELVSRLVAWAKRGRRIRRYLALAAIFVLLVYYHSIGKKVAAGWKEACRE